MNRYVDRGLRRMSPEAYGEDYARHLLELYKLYVKTANAVSDRRTSANNYLLTINSFLVTLYGLAAGFDRGAVWRLTIPAAGILVSITWWVLIRNYRNLNTAKFAVIHELEEQLPAAVFTREWEHAGRGQASPYRPLTHVEQWIPLTFGVLYLVLGVYAQSYRAVPRAALVDPPPTTSAPLVPRRAVVPAATAIPDV